MINPKRWKSFWDVQVTPLHYGDTEEWYRKFAEEINALIDTAGYAGGPVLESGCGNGALFKYLLINKSEYVGVDFSKRMLQIFRSRFSDVNLICADAAVFYVNRHFELIFSNGVVQYFNHAMIQRYVHNSFHMLKKGGVLLIANVPWKDLRSGYVSGTLYQEPVVDSRHRFTRNLLSLLKGDGLGYWYNPQDFFGFSRLGFRVTLFGSLYHPYRFSISLKKEF
ncbi:class I SAM-dependent methyltransferase [Roseiflexus castenholzii]|jgi:SAM-dependent methyltransferase|uniref:Methyltransferase type 12 n=1 Tax=Roseiflexus castenholzii (strain DSM 13941 / HLO8) TaxID=383372 RepID=A7NHE1_ROSCS|nr:class I SAM-dependent methyltransferase [Roseiflexus castenholzii]ABU56888.1 Methyltransferase type 12 [Roseiflexus castenholzii DSM 13941]